MKPSQKKIKCQRGVRPAKPCAQNCPKCGGEDISRRHRKLGESVKKSCGEKSNCAPSLPWLDSDWPYGWKVSREHIGHHCRVCGCEWQSAVKNTEDAIGGSDVRRKFSEWCDQIKSNYAFCVDSEISYEKFVADLFVIHFLNTRGCSMATARLHAIDFLAAEQRTSPSETVGRENAEAISAPSPGNQSETIDVTRHPVAGRASN